MQNLKAVFEKLITQSKAINTPGVINAIENGEREKNGDTKNKVNEVFNANVTLIEAAHTRLSRLINASKVGIYTTA